MKNIPPKKPKKYQLSYPLFLMSLMFGLFFIMLLTSNSGPKELSYVEFKKYEKESLINKNEPLELKDKKNLIGQLVNTENKEELKDKSRFIMKLDPYADQEFIKHLRKEYPEFRMTESPDLSFLWFLIPILLLLFFIMSAKNALGSSGPNSILGKATKSKFNKINPDDIKVTLKDVAGIDEARDEVYEIVEFLKNPKKFQDLGAKIPKGVLLSGRPGTGKTLLAKIIAKEANVPFLAGTGSGFVEMFVGVGASRVRDIFNEAKSCAPCIIFIDEIDSIGGKRDGGYGGGGHAEKEQTINELLSQMDGFETNPGIIVMAATNRPDSLDEALKRPGRFDRQITVPLPSLKGREDILKIHTKKLPLSTDVDLKVLARRTHNFSGANIENLANEAAIVAVREDSEKVSMPHFEKAMDRLLMGLENKSLVVTEAEKKKTAIHEAGHTIVNKFFKKTLDPLHKVSISPRGQALGVTMTLPEGEYLNYGENKCKHMISMLMGGRVAEKIFYDEVTTGASDDINKATQIARSMVFAWGMSELGPINIDDNSREFQMKNKFSESIRTQADNLVQQIIKDAEKVTFKILEDNKESLENLANSLLEKETLDANEVDNIITLTE